MLNWFLARDQDGNIQLHSYDVQDLVDDGIKEVRVGITYYPNQEEFEGLHTIMGVIDRELAEKLQILYDFDQTFGGGTIFDTIACVMYRIQDAYRAST